MTETQTTTGPLATIRQKAYLLALLDVRVGFSAGFEARVRADLETAITKTKASEIIDWMQKLPVKGAPVTDAKTPVGEKLAAAVDVPAGFYAVKSATGTNDLDFFSVVRPTDGKWRGYTFVNRIIGGHRAHGERRMSPAQRSDALKRIADAGIVDAASRYAKEIGRCVYCNRTLTDEASRALGIGPVCVKDHAEHALIKAMLVANREMETV